MKIHFHPQWPAALAILFSVGISSGCQTLGPGAATGGAFGSLAGGLTGAAIGAHEGKASQGAVIGALTGGTLGTIAGDAADRQIERDRLQYESAVDRQRRSAVSIQQVIQMTENGLGKNVIISQIGNQGVDRRPSIDDLILLKNRGIDEEVIQAFQNAPLSVNDAAINAFPSQAIIREPVYVESFIPRPIYGHRYRRGCRPRAGFSVNF